VVVLHLSGCMQKVHVPAPLLFNNVNKKRIKMENEIWKKVDGFDFYEVSNHGRIKSFYNKREIIRKQQKRKDGYLHLNIVVSGNRKKILSHRFIAFAFLENPLNKKEVNHINGIKTDNRVENLEWSTRSENEKHAFSSGLKQAKKHESHPVSKLTNEQVLYIKKNYKKGNGAELGRMFSVTKGTINKIIKGRSWLSL